MVYKIKQRIDVLNKIDKFIDFNNDDYYEISNFLRNTNNENLIACSVIYKDIKNCLQWIEKNYEFVNNNQEYVNYRNHIFKKYYEKEINTLCNMANNYVRTHRKAYTPYDKQINYLRHKLNKLNNN